MKIVSYTSRDGNTTNNKKKDSNNNHGNHHHRKPCHTFRDFIGSSFSINNSSSSIFNRNKDNNNKDNINFNNDNNNRVNNIEDYNNKNNNHNDHNNYNSNRGHTGYGGAIKSNRSNCKRDNRRSKGGVHTRFGISSTGAGSSFFARTVDNYCSYYSTGAIAPNFLCSANAANVSNTTSYTTTSTICVTTFTSAATTSTSTTTSRMINIRGCSKTYEIYENIKNSHNRLNAEQHITGCINTNNNFDEEDYEQGYEDEYGEGYEEDVEIRTAYFVNPDTPFVRNFLHITYEDVILIAVGALLFSLLYAGLHLLKQFGESDERSTWPNNTRSSRGRNRAPRHRPR
ncbi:hypothetical protein PoB_002038700 [Plakobranchus ocellatus]|uniref:Uncharacterized protein n=1 Tax=Plakobranchus ocellatus TaxID=259542 RepID=A0AAV3ZHA6_9GAST|nr:hypothetical protein PoB_002038700 [Plakobranchus ocellatus]